METDKEIASLERDLERALDLLEHAFLGFMYYSVATVRSEVAHYLVQHGRYGGNPEVAHKEIGRDV